MRHSWSKISETDILDSWNDAVAAYMQVYARMQSRAATVASDAQGSLLASAGDYIMPDVFINPTAFTGRAASGATLREYLSGPVYDALTLIGKGMRARQALDYVESRAETLAALGIADIARQAAGADTATRPGVGYIRVCAPGACSRCMILAGRFYRWNQGFLRHPHCYCRHFPCTQKIGEQWMTDPMEAFNSLSHEEQDRRFGKYSAQAIRDGADISQVVNARSGVQAIGSKGRAGRTVPDFTTYGNANRRGFNKSFYNEYHGAGPRLTPEGCYRLAAGDREKALELLDDNGYIVDQSWRDWRETMQPNAGRMGRGGRAKSHAEAYRQAMRTGIRNPDELGTMTSAERRLYEARLRYIRALSGSDMNEMAAAERNFRHQLANNGEIHVR